MSSWLLLWARAWAGRGGPGDPVGLASTLCPALACVRSLRSRARSPRAPPSTWVGVGDLEGLAPALLSRSFEETWGRLAFCGLTYLPFECGIIKILMLWKHNWYIFKN